MSKPIINFTPVNVAQLVNTSTNITRINSSSTVPNFVKELDTTTLTGEYNESDLLPLDKDQMMLIESYLGRVMNHYQNGTKTYLFKHLYRALRFLPELPTGGVSVVKKPHFQYQLQEEIWKMAYLSGNDQETFCFLNFLEAYLKLRRHVPTIKPDYYLDNFIDVFFSNILTTSSEDYNYNQKLNIMYTVLNAWLLRSGESQFGFKVIEGLRDWLNGKSSYNAFYRDFNEYLELETEYDVVKTFTDIVSTENGYKAVHVGLDVLDLTLLNHYMNGSTSSHAELMLHYLDHTPHRSWVEFCKAGKRIMIMDHYMSNEQDAEDFLAVAEQYKKANEVETRIAKQQLQDEAHLDNVEDFE